MATREKKLELILFFVKIERAMSKVETDTLSIGHKENAEVLAEIYRDIAELYN